MNYFQSMPRSKKVVYLLTLLYLLPFFILLMANAILSILQTTYMELYQDTEKPLYKSDHPLLLIILAFIFVICLTIFFKKHPITPKTCSHFEWFSLIWSFALSLFIVFLFRVRVACDSSQLSDIAIEFLNGNYSSLTGDGYLVHYPHQLGMIALLEIVYGIFGIENFIVMQFLNVFSIVSTVYFLHRISDEMFHNSRVQITLSILCVGILPLYLYATFIYGDIPSLGLAAPAIYYVLRYLNTSKKAYAIPAVVFMTLSIQLKSNSTIFLVAAIIILLLHMFSKKDKFALLFAVLLIGVPYITGNALNACYAHAAGMDHIPSGIPKIAWVAMGLQSNDYIENGWYNSYNWDIYTQNNYDVTATTDACISSIRQSVSELVSHPKTGLNFFYKKFISQWNDPGYQSQITIEWYSRHRDDQSGLALYLIYGNGRLILEALMNFYHFTILLGSTVFAFHSIKKHELTDAFLPLCVFGGYFFHLIWEAGGRYGLCYFVLCLPMAAWGFGKLTELCTRLLNQRANLPHQGTKVTDSNP